MVSRHRPDRRTDRGHPRAVHVAARRPARPQRKRRAEIERIRADARAFASDHLADPLFIAGTVLYWGEGAKSSRFLSLANTDAAVLRLFLRWTRRFHDARAQFVAPNHGLDRRRR
jgi:hypothetical protein